MSDEDELITPKAALRMEVLQELAQTCDRETYNKRKREAAQKLGVTIRSIERLIKRYREAGVEGFTKGRSDKGKYRIGADWYRFIVQAYKEGNQGDEVMSRNRVFSLVQERAEQLGLKSHEHPSHSSVYRILDEYIGKEEEKQVTQTPESLEAQTDENNKKLVDEYALLVEQFYIAFAMSTETTERKILVSWNDLSAVEQRHFIAGVLTVVKPTKHELLEVETLLIESHQIWNSSFAGLTHRSSSPESREKHYRAIFLAALKHSEAMAKLRRLIDSVPL